MRYLASRFVWAVTVCLVLVGPCFAQVGIRVNETATRIQITSAGTIVDLSIENQTRETISTHVLLELVDPKGVVQVHADHCFGLIPASGSFAASAFPVPSLSPLGSLP